MSERLQMPEHVRIETEMMTGEEFMRRMKPAGVSDPRFLSFKSGGVFELPPLGRHSTISEKDTYCAVVHLNDLIVGYAEIKYREDQKRVDIENVCIQKDLKGLRRSSNQLERGFKFSERLLGKVMDFAKEHDCYVAKPRNFSDEGLQKIPPLLEKIAKEKNVRLL